jgi:hypothetical protein
MSLRPARQSEPDKRGLNPACRLPYGLDPKHVLKAMGEFTEVPDVHQYATKHEGTAEI